ncbi:MAG: Ig-like domain-containing protein, partial [Myxococcota bacterium]
MRLFNKVLFGVGGAWVLLVLSMGQRSLSLRAQTRGEANLFAGLPAMKKSGREISFQFRSGPKPPGQIDKRVSIPFPPKAPAPGAMQSDAKKSDGALPLRVVRIAPKGEVKLTRAVTVTFNQPMVPLSSVNQLRSKRVPFKIVPQPKQGQFRWLGTRTVSFEPKVRFPLSTDYTVIVPKGLKSMSGQVLAKEVRSTFSTPTLKVVRTYPTRWGRTHLRPKLAFLWNQDIDPKVVRKSFRLRGPRGNVPVEWVPREQWKTWRKGKGALPFQNWRKERTIAFRLKRDLKRNTSYVMTWKAGVKSTEGPKPMPSTWTQNFRTYGPLKVVRARCTSWRRSAFFFKHCMPDGQIRITFSNPLQNTPENLKKVKAPKGVRVRISYRSIRLYGEDGLPAQSQIRVTVGKELKDTYQQKLGKPYQVTFAVGDAQPYLHVPRSGMSVLEAGGDRRIAFRSRNVKKVRVRVVPVQQDKVMYWRWMSQRVRGSQYRKKSPVDGAELMVDQNITIKGAMNKANRFSLDMNALLKGKQGWFFVLLTSSNLQINRWASAHRAMLVQITNMGLTARYAPNKIAVLGVDFAKGSPLRGSAIEAYRVRSNRAVGPSLWKGKLNAQGAALLPGARTFGRGSVLLVVRQRGGQDKSFLILEGGGRDTVGYISGYRGWGRVPKKRTAMMFFFTEREPHKPGETVYVRGVARARINTPKGGIQFWKKMSASWKYEIRSPRWKIVKKGKLKVRSDGN